MISFSPSAFLTDSHCATFLSLSGAFPQTQGSLPRLEELVHWIVHLRITPARHFDPNKNVSQLTAFQNEHLSERTSFWPVHRARVYASSFIFFCGSRPPCSPLLSSLHSVCLRNGSTYIEQGIKRLDRLEHSRARARTHVRRTLSQTHASVLAAKTNVQLV